VKYCRVRGRVQVTFGEGMGRTAGVTSCNVSWRTGKGGSCEVRVEFGVEKRAVEDVRG